MDPQNKHRDDELLDRLLNEYLLEEGDDAAVEQSLDILSEQVFQDEAVIEPGAAREKKLQEITKGKNGFDLGFNATTVTLGIILLLLIAGILFLANPSDQQPSISAVPNHKPLSSERKQETAITSTVKETANEIEASPEIAMPQQENSGSNTRMQAPAGPGLPALPPVEQLNEEPDFKWLKEKLAGVNNNAPKDRLYLRTDKSLYKTGERVWLAVYVRDATTLRKSTMSEVVYVHLINPKNQVEKSIRLIVRDGIASGDFLLEEQYAGGVYKLKTYTSWQKNQPGMKLFEKEIQVQQLVDSDIALKLDFEKEQFTKDEKIKATVKFQNSKGEPVKDFSFQCVVTLADEKKLEFENTTNELGIAMLEFKFPDKADVRKGFLNFYFEYQGNTEHLSERIPVQSTALKFELFPEGGQLVEGITSRVAFQALDDNGTPVDVQGIVTDDAGHQVVAFASIHEGRGSFEFQPVAGKTYKATVQNADRSATINMPKANSKGFVLQADSSNAQFVYVNVKSVSDGAVFLSAIQRGKLCYSNRHDVVAGENLIKLPIATLSMGVLQITLFNAQGIPQAERLVFINEHKRLNIAVTSSQNSFAMHEKVKVDLAIKNEQGNPQSAHAAVSVINEHLLVDQSSANASIFSSLFLNPDLNAEHLNNECYFHAATECNAEELDLLLLTKGWRMFSWENIEAPKRSAYANERALVAGRILDAVNSRPIEGVEITLPDGVKTITDAKGKFSFAKLNLEDRIELTLAYGKEKMTYYVSEYDDKLEIIFYGDGKRIYQPQEQGIRHPLVKALRKSSAESAMLLGKVAGRNYKPLTGASIKLMRNGLLISSTLSDINGYYQIETSESGMFDLIVAHGNYREHSYTGYKIEKGKALLLDVLLSDEKLPVDSLNRTNAVATLSTSYPVKVPALKTTQLSLASGVDFNKVLDGFSERYSLDDMGTLYLKEFKEQNKVYVDGLSLEYNKGVSISKDNIEEISIYNSEEGAAQPDGKTDCIIEIKTAGGANEISTKERKELFVSRYYRARQFPGIYYNPDKKEPVGNDFRTTLYWNPLLQANDNGEAVAEFYSSDVPGKYKIVIEGISEDGKAGYAELSIEVREQ